MKRSTSSSHRPRQQKFKKSKKITNDIGSLPQELQTEIFARVGATSCKDIINCKMCCKLFKEIGEDRHVYQHLTLENLPAILPWSPPNEHKQAFLDKCLESNNPEINYRQAVMDYFGEEKVESAYKCLQRAVNSGHIGALYVTCIALLFSGDEESRKIGVNLLKGMKRSMSDRRELIECRKKLVKQLGMIWVKHPCFETLPVCCTKHKHKYKQDYVELRCDVDESEDILTCEGCSAEWEIKLISAYNNFVSSRYDWVR